MLCTKMTDFSLSQWSIIDVDSVHWLLYCVDVGNVADIFEVYAVSMLSVYMHRLVNLCIYTCRGWTK
jgi:hypothetical protein